MYDREVLFITIKLDYSKAPSIGTAVPLRSTVPTTASISSRSYPKVSSRSQSSNPPLLIKQKLYLRSCHFSIKTNILSIDFMRCVAAKLQVKRLGSVAIQKDYANLTVCYYN